MVHCFDQDLHAHKDISVHKHSKLSSVSIGIALAMNDSHLLDEGTLSCLSSTWVQWNTQFNLGPTQ